MAKKGSRGNSRWPRYVSVAEKRAKGQKSAKKISANGKNLEPIEIDGRTITKTFWGNAWCRNLEAYSDFENRLPRGRTYARNGSIIDLKISEGNIEALVAGSALYKVKIQIACLDSKIWETLVKFNAGQIGSLIELLQGKLSKTVMESVVDAQSGLFPNPKEITLHCSCPDWAAMCKHIAAVMYGIGHRLDHQPELLFKLRKVNHLDLMQAASPSDIIGQSQALKALETNQDLGDLFGIEMDIESFGAEQDIGSNGKEKTVPVKLSKAKTKPARIKTVKAKVKTAKTKLKSSKTKVERAKAETKPRRVKSGAKSPR